MSLTTSLYSGSLMAGASLALALWSYIPLYLLPVQIGLLLKMSIEVRDRYQSPRRSDELTNEHRHFRKERLLRTLRLVINTSDTKSGFHIESSRTSGKRQFRTPDTSLVNQKFASVRCPPTRALAVAIPLRRYHRFVKAAKNHQRPIRWFPEMLRTFESILVSNAY